MDKILVVCRKCVRFDSPDGESFLITPAMRGIFVEAPAWIKDTLMFRWLVNEGSLTAVTDDNKVNLENDPMKGIAADGTAEKPEEKIIKERKPRKKAEPKE